MYEKTNRDVLKASEAMLQLPVQAAPIYRGVTGSTLASDSGVQPQDALHYMLTAALILALL